MTGWSGREPSKRVHRSYDVTADLRDGFSSGVETHPGVDAQDAPPAELALRLGLLETELARRPFRPTQPVPHLRVLEPQLHGGEQTLG
jgi:hypothetical protein